MARKSPKITAVTSFVPLENAVRSAVNRVILAEAKLVEVTLDYTAGVQCSPDRIYTWADHVRAARRTASIERAALESAKRQAVRDGSAAIRAAGTPGDSDTEGDDSCGVEPGPVGGVEDCAGDDCDCSDAGSLICSRDGDA